MLSVQTRQLGVVTSVRREHTHTHTHTHKVVHTSCKRTVKSMCKTYVTTIEFQWKKVAQRSESKMVVRRPIAMASENRREEEIGF